MSKIDNAVSFAEDVARDDSHGYDQNNRWGNPDYDCSGLVIDACERAGIPLKTNGATYTGNIYQPALKSGFKDVTSSVNLSTGAGLKRGDILLKPNGHVAFYCGNGKMVDARINEKGTITGGKKGDQTGKEIMIHAYRNHPFKYVLRYGGKSSEESNATQKIDVDGEWGRETTKLAQRVFCTPIDGIVSRQIEAYRKYMPNCLSSSWQFKKSGYHGGSELIKAIQKWIGVEQDGLVGPKTIKALQRKLSVKADGYMGGQTVTAFQKYLNSI